MAHQLPAANIWVAVTTEVIAVLLEGHTADQWNDLEAMLAEVESVVNFRAKKTGNVRTVRVFPTVIQFPADSGAANVRILFNYKRAQARFGEKCGIGQAVVACTDNNGVVVVHRPVLIRLIVGILLRKR